MWIYKVTPLKGQWNANYMLPTTKGTKYNIQMGSFEKAKICHLCGAYQKNIYPAKGIEYGI